MYKYSLPNAIMILIISLIVTPGLLQADIFIKEKVTQGGMEMMGQTQPGSEMIQDVWITADKMRSDDEEHTTIMRLDQNKIYIINHVKKTYQVLQLDFGQKIKKEMEKEQSSEDMAALMNMAEGMKKMEFSVTPTSEKKKIGKWNCTKYIQRIQTPMGPNINEIWATDELKMDYELYAKFSASMMSAMPGAQSMINDITNEMKKIKGVPVLTITTMEMMGQKIESKTQLIEFKEGPVPANTFDVPSGYKQMETIQFGQ
jgi:hypothetical protein